MLLFTISGSSGFCGVDANSNKTKADDSNLTAAELDYLNLYGELHRRKLKFKDIPAEKLLYQTLAALIL